MISASSAAAPEIPSIILNPFPNEHGVHHDGTPNLRIWVTYELGSENQNMPGSIGLTQPGGEIKSTPPALGQRLSSHDLPEATMRPAKNPILNLALSQTSSQIGNQRRSI
ncbi:MAG: hypothetical protein M2R45_02337 [Verrucomicrobia subdivision 3 bacterium]|nr:hypothetical protein [Limisphaerales bacterium]MCS1414889.1 hypothetical protein [Limisphaerales bacterium]